MFPLFDISAITHNVKPEMLCVLGSFAVTLCN